MRRRSAAYLAAAAALGLLPVAPALAVNEIGVTSAVLPNAQGTPPGQDTRILQVGYDVFADERVQTVGNGKVHLLFLDGSAMSIGPDSDIVLDEFVYNPDSKSGTMAFSATKGVFRFVGGRISKTTPVTIRTPTATIGVRGGVALITVGETIQATLIFGEELFVTVGDVTRRITRSGFRLEVTPDGRISQPVAAESQDLGEPLNQLEGDPTQTQETQDLVTETDVAGSQLSSLGSGNPPAAVAPADQSAPEAPSSELAEREAESRESTEADRGQDNPDVGGGGGAIGTGLSGAYRHANDRTMGTDLDGDLDERIISATLAGGRFEGTTEFGSIISYPVSTTPANDGTPGSGSYLDYGAGSGSTSLFGPMEPGRSFVADSGDFTFAFADENSFPGHGVFVYAGVSTPRAAFPSSGVFAYALHRDQFLNGDLPFTAASFGGQIGFPGDVIGRAYINWQENGSGERAFVAANAGIAGTGSGQQSAITVMIGQVRDDGDDVSLDNAHMRGSIRTSTDFLQRTVYLGSAVETRDAADEQDFFGSAAPNFFVLDADADDDFDPSPDEGVSFLTADSVTGLSSITGQVVPNVPGVRVNDPEEQTRTPGALILETAGLAPVTDAVSLGLNPFITNTAGASALLLGSSGFVSATADVINPDGDGGFGAGTIFRFGGSSETSAYVAGDIFGAIEASAPSSVNGSPVLRQALYFTSLDGVRTAGALPADIELCECSFLKAGFWGGQVRSDLLGETREHDLHLVPWVAGPPVNAADIPSSGGATYAGNVIANVFDSGFLYTAVGTFDATVSFSPGVVTINSLDIAADGAAISMIGSGPKPGPFPVAGGGNRGSVSLTSVGNVRFAGTNQAENIYGAYAARSGDGDYRQAGVLGGNRTK